MSSAPATHQHHHPEGRDRKAGLTLIVAGCLPFALGGALAATDSTDRNLVTCPFRLITGLPCPLCGGTRAFSYAASGNSKFLSYNGFWVFVAAAMIVMGLLLMFTRVSLSGLWSKYRGLSVVLVVALLAGGWIWSLSNRGLIVS